MTRTACVKSLLFSLLLFFLPTAAFAAAGPIDLTSTTTGLVALVVFTLAYILVMGEEKLHLRKSKPVLVAAGIIWVLIGTSYVANGMPDEAEGAFRHTDAVPAGCDDLYQCPGGASRL